MDAVTYPEKKVVEFVHNYLIPLRINVNDGSIHEGYHHIWTPALAVLDLSGREIQKKIGFFSVDEFLASMHLGIAKVRFSIEEYDVAMVHLKRLLDDCSGTSLVPEAIYFSGVTQYKMKNDPGKLKEAYEKLKSDFPDDVWAKRAYPYRLI